MRRWTIRIAALLGLVGLGIGLRMTVFSPQAVPVEVVAAARGVVEATVTNSRAGTVKARRRAKLSPEIGGTVVELPHREGEPVTAGAVVLRLDDTLQRARLAVAEREVEAAVADRRRPCLTAERAGRELERMRGLIADGIISTDRIDQFESAAETSTAACGAAVAAEARAGAAVELAAAELTRTVLRSPFDGVVAELAVEIGEYSTPAPPAVPVPPVIDVIDPSSIYTSAPMDEVDSARIRPGQEVRITVDSHRGDEFAGRVVRVAPYVLDVEEQNRTVEIEVEFADRDFAATLLPGTSADVEVIIERREGVLRIPTASLLEGQRVLELVDGRLRSHEVEVGLRNWDFVEVRAGLGEGALVVTSLEGSEVRDGAPAVAAGAEADGGPER
ncbi:MAG: efflux RND transporter periplasmic adaptor subunit [bacterium]|nr:efflux RND transporter periplasmic adaptor subunit [bacterium]